MDTPLRPEPLPSSECHLWVVRVDEVLAAGEERYLAWLAADERERVRRYRFERNQREHLVTRALARAVLSHYAPVAPRDWVFATGPFGKPHLVGPEPLPRMSFNLSNAGEVVVCAVAAAGELGVDVEPLEGHGDPLELAQLAFSAAELAELRALPEADRRERFVVLWTLKEAYVKARGLGLSLPTNRFSVTLEGTTGARLTFDPAVRDEPAGWQLARVYEVPGHRIGVALRRPPGADLVVRVRHSPTLDLGAAAIASGEPGAA